ncbi:PDZ domain-containing protein [Phytophthora fragariae]|uniref:PDZ domain-containing protein n=1 Tax=Phytophthora fragariae TaxID=53985 RepID=A0A6G0M2H7_9STRA|nr:PDZ domain-containing protein [Phytophthora fragariae]KAE9255236.1 PDZ domain-containing protein [Phytophthora fragariae]
MWKAGPRAATTLRRSPTSWRPVASAQLLCLHPRVLQALPSGLGGAARFSSTSSSSTPTTQNAQMAVAALAAAGVGYLFVSTERQSDQEKQQRELEIQQERKLSDRLAAELVAAEANQSKLDWKPTLERVVPAIVSLKLNSPKFFDTESPGNGSATGFVVDAEKGIILTNRHVVGPGPIDAEAVFQNNEEVRVIPIYRDPVHDFGFFQFNPADVKHMSVPSLRLEPDKATVGTDIRVVGNDAAEKLAIASGTLARLDRDAPNYGYNNYNDFNTFYYQASSGTTGGSSGSPVLNHDGNAIALNAGGKIGTSASFYLPLDRVKRAFDLIREGKDVPRGTIQTIFNYKPFDEVRRLGVDPATERLVRSSFPLETGMLTVAETIPGGPSSSKLQPGDVLVRVNGELTTRFVPLEAILDDNVGEEIELQIERSGELVTHMVQVQNLHSVTPSRFIEIGGAVINPLSYQQARNHAMSPGAPYVADPGYFLQRSRIGRGAIIHSVNGTKTPDLETLKNYLKQCKDRDRIVVKFSKLTDKSEKVEVVHVDRRWFPFCEYARDDKLGIWHCEHFAPPTEGAGGDVKPSGQKEPIGSTTTLPGKNAVENKLARSLVTVDFDRPFSVNSLSTSNYRGTGLVIDAEKGLVVVDRNTVTDSMGDAMVTFASTIMVPAHVVFVHPVHNFAIVQYDPKLIGSTPIESCQVASKPLVPSDPVWLVGLMSSVGRSGHSDLVSRETIVSGVKWIGLPMPNPPRYQEHNLEMVALQDVVGTEGGVVCSDKGEVSAFWASFSFQQQRRSSKVESQFNRGIPMELIMESAAPLMRGATPRIYDLGVDFEHLSLAKARELGLGQALAEILEKDAPDRRTILSVARRWGGTEAKDVLKNGDILVAVDGKIVTSFREVERCTQKPEVQLTIVRDGREMQLDVKTLFMERTEINRIVFWQGLLLQAPPLSVSAQRSISLEDGIYVSCRYSGSPAARYGPPPTSRIKEIDGIKITSIDDFVHVVTAKSDNDSVRIKYTDLSGKDRLSTVKLEPKYWPTSELVHEGGEWHRHQL